MMPGRTSSPKRERWPSTQRQRGAFRPLLRFWTVLLAIAAGGAGVLQALGPPSGSSASVGAAPKAATVALAETAAPQSIAPASPVQTPSPPEPVQAPAPQPLEVVPAPPIAEPLPPAQQAEHPTIMRAPPARPNASVRRRARSDRLALAMERLRRERQPMPDNAEAAEGDNRGYAAAESWHAPVQYPWLYGWPTETQAYYYPYPGRR